MMIAFWINNICWLILLYAALLIAEQEGARMAGTFIIHNILIPIYCMLVLISCIMAFTGAGKRIWFMFAGYYALLAFFVAKIADDPDMIHKFM